MARTCCQNRDSIDKRVLHRRQPERRKCGCYRVLIAATVLVCCIVRSCAASGALAVLGPATGIAAAPGRHLQGSGRLSELLLQKYLSNEQLAAWMDEYISKCSKVARKFSIGKSHGGLDLWVLEISSNPGVLEPKPNYRYIANMHGNEPSGRMLLPMLAEWLCEQQGRDPRATRLVEGAHLFIVPTMNPDGFALRRRENKAGVDLNRNFPDPILMAGNDLTQPTADVQPETLAIMNFTRSRKFVGSVNCHEGAIVANYPYDGFPDGSEQLRAGGNPSPDDATFKHLAKTYAKHHDFMSTSTEFPEGITNGAHWYPVYGGMQDWNYVAADCMSITLELSENKWRPERDLPKLWDENKDALVALALEATLGGVRGTVTSTAGAPLPAIIVVEGIAHNISTELQNGFYARSLAPGTYTMSAVSPGYEISSAKISVPADGQGAIQDFKLKAVGPSETSQEAAARGETVVLTSRRFIRRYDGGGSGGSMYIVGVHLFIIGALAAMFACQGTGIMQQKQLQ